MAEASETKVGSWYSEGIWLCLCPPYQNSRRDFDGDTCARCRALRPPETQAEAASLPHGDDCECTPCTEALPDEPLVGTWRSDGDWDCGCEPPHSHTAAETARCPLGCGYVRPASAKVGTWLSHDAWKCACPEPEWTSDRYVRLCGRCGCYRPSEDAQPAATPEPGVKHDAGKTPWHLFDWGVLDDVAKVLAFGAAKYPSADNWRRVEGWRWRYFRAAIGHTVAWWRGERLDPESGLPTLAHAITCLMFLAAKDNEGDARG